MKRKLVKLGNSTMVTSLPSKWVNKFDLKPGDEIELEEQGNKLVIYTNKEKKKEVNELTLEFDKSKYIKRVVAALYKKGYDEIIIHSSNPKVLDYIEGLIDAFIGVEVIERTKERIVISDVVAIDEQQFDIVYRRSLMISLQCARDIHEALKNKDNGLFDKVIKTEILHNKLTDFCKRLLAKKGYKEELKVKYYYALVQENERIVDEMKYIAKYLKDKKFSKAAVDYFGRVVKLLESFYDLHYNYEHKKLYGLVIERQTIEEECRNLMSKSPADALLYHHIMNLTIMVYESAEPYLEMIY